MSLEDCLFLKELGLIQPSIAFYYTGNYHVLFKENVTYGNAEEITELAMTGHDLDALAYEPSLEEMWKFVIKKMTENQLYSLVMNYDWDKRKYIFQSAYFPTELSASDQLSGLFMALTMSLFTGPLSEGTTC